MTLEELNKALEKSQKKQQIALNIGLVAALGSVICTAVLILYQICC